MKLTGTLQHAKRFFWGKGWGEKPRKNTDNFYWKMQWQARSKRQVEVIPQALPDGVEPIDANLYMKLKLKEEFGSHIPENFQLPWPYSNRPLKGSPADPAYKPSALVYQRHKRLLEPINFPLHFTNTILEEGVPERILHFQEQIRLDEEALANAAKRINWCMNNDSSMRKLPLRREFPYLDQRPPRVHGISDQRKENNLLWTLHDLARQNCAKQFGINSDVILQRVSDLNCVISLQKDDKDIVLDLQSNFVTLLQNMKPSGQTTLPSFAPKSVNSQPPKVASIEPLSWETGFDMKNFYPDNTEFAIPKESSIQTIYLSNNNLRVLTDLDYQGRAIMYCYGYALQQARLRSGQLASQDLSEVKLDTPINVQCVFTNPRSWVVGSVLFELNSVNPNDRENVNRAWLLPALSVEKDTEAVLRNVIAINSNGVHY